MGFFYYFIVIKREDVSKFYFFSYKVILEIGKKLIFEQIAIYMLLKIIHQLKDNYKKYFKV